MKTARNKQPLCPMKLHFRYYKREMGSDDYSIILPSPTFIPRNAKFKLIHTYIIQRASLSPDKINKYFNTDTSACPRCHQTDADLLHVLWSCPSLQTYWREVTNALMKSTKTQIAFTCEVCILGLYVRTKKMKVNSRFKDLGLIVAKRLITRRWKNPTPPTALSWEKSLVVWAWSESIALQREETAGLRKNPIAQSWDQLLQALQKDGDDAVALD